METIEEFETFVRDRVVALHMGLPQKISARKLSYAIGQSAGYINKIETGQSLPSLSGLYYICKYFGITPKEFFDDGQRAPEKLRHLMDELVQLSDAQLEAVTAVVENMRKPCVICRTVLQYISI